MSEPITSGKGNSGVVNTGSGTVNISQSAIGDHAAVHVTHARESAAGSAARHEHRSDLGVITVLSEETNAVASALETAGRCSKEVYEQARFLDATLDTEAGQVRVVATQALHVGSAPAVIAFERLRRYCDPPIVVLVGIAGGIHPAVSLGDVVVVQEVIYYDTRKQTPDRIFRRGQTRPVPSGIRHAINDFFSTSGEPCYLRAQDPDGSVRDYRVLPGPIGSGEAVIADKNSPIRRYIAGFNDKTLAVETEAGGLAEAFYEAVGTSAGGWLAIRGISDHADAGKDDSYHRIASWHAAAVLLSLVPYLAAG